MSKFKPENCRLGASCECATARQRTLCAQYVPPAWSKYAFCRQYLERGALCSLRRSECPTCPEHLWFEEHWRVIHTWLVRSRRPERWEAYLDSRARKGGRRAVQLWSPDGSKWTDDRLEVREYVLATLTARGFGGLTFLERVQAKRAAAKGGSAGGTE